LWLETQKEKQQKALCCRNALKTNLNKFLVCKVKTKLLTWSTGLTTIHFL